MEKFSYEANGYNRQEVNAFIDDVIKQTEGIITKCKEQNAALTRAEAELNHYRSLEGSLKVALEQSEHNAANIKRMAQEQADMVVTDAKHNASRIVNEALLEADRIEQNTATLERNIKIFKRKLKIIMAEEQAVVDQIEVLDFPEDEDSSK